MNTPTPRQAAVALALAAASTFAFAGPIETLPTDTRVDISRAIPKQSETSEGYLSNVEQAATIGQGRPVYRDDVIAAQPRILTGSSDADAQLGGDVARALANDPALRGAYLDVDVYAGEVRLTGRALDLAQASHARRVAESVAGPARVTSYIDTR